MKRKSVCIIFFGMNRSLSKTFASIDECIFQPLRNISLDFDVYTSFMDPGESFSNLRSNERNMVVEYESAQLLKPTIEILTDQREFDKLFNEVDLSQYDDAWKDNHSSTRNLFRQLYSIKVGYESAINSGRKYDYYFFFRPDMRYLDAFNYCEYIVHLERILERGTIITPDWHLFGGLNDRYAMCNSVAAKVYSSRFDHAVEYLVANKRIHSETFLLDILKQESVDFSLKSHEKAMRVRADYLVDLADMRLDRNYDESIFRRAIRKLFRRIRAYIPARLQ